MCDIANPTPDSGTRRPTRHLRSSISHITKMLGSKLRTRGATLVAALMLLGSVAGERTAFAQVTSFTTTFGAASIPLNGTTSLTFQLSDNAPTPDAFTDTLPAGLVVASPNGVSAVTGNCTGTTITAVAGSSSISLAGLSFAVPNESCSFSVNVTGTTAGVKNNSVSDTGNAFTASASLTVVSFGHVQFGASTGVTQTIPFNVPSGTTLGNPAYQVYTTGMANLDFTVVPSGTTCATGTTNTTCHVNVQFLPTAPGLRRGALVLYDNSVPQNPVLTVPIYAFADAPVAALSPSTASVISTGSATLSFPFQTALDGSGNMYVGNYTGSNVVKVPAGGGIGTVVSTGSLTLGQVTGVALDGAGNLFIADYTNSRIVVVTPGGVASHLTINGLPTTPSSGQVLYFPAALNFDGAGNLYIADYLNNRVVEVSSLVVAGATSSGYGSVIGTGSYVIASDSLSGLAVDQNGTIYIADRANNRVVQVTAAGVASLFSPAGITFNFPEGVGVDAMGNIYVADSLNSRVVETTTAGVVSVVSVNGLPSPPALSSNFFGASVDPYGNIFIADSPNNRIVEVPVAGASLSFANTNVGSKSSDSPQVATVTNLGNQDLNFSANPTYTLNFSENTSDGNLCASATSLLAGTACDVAVNFTPQSYGSLSAGITTTNNSLNNANSTQQVSASGMGEPDPTVTMLADSGSGTSTYGQPVTFTATVLSGSNPVTAGTVTFIDTTTSTTLAGNATLNSNGLATVTLSTLTVGGHTIKATYNPDANHLTSNNTDSFVVNKATPVITLNSSANPAAVLTPVTLTANVSSGVGMPTGGVTFYDGASLLASIQLTAGVATYTSSNFVVGPHSFTATYSGDANFLTLTSSPISEQINKVTPTLNWNPTTAISYGTTLSVLTNAIALNGPSTVPGNYTYTETPTGGSASAATAATILAPGTYTIGVTFTPTNPADYQSVSATSSLTVNKGRATVTVISSVNPVFAANPVTFTANVTSANAAPTGTVSFVDGQTQLASVSLAQGTATYTTSNLALGGHTITAVYSGDVNYVSLPSSPVTETVEDFSVSVSIPAGQSASPAILPGGSLNFNIQVVPTLSATFPSAVSFSASGLPTGATAKFAPATLAAGTTSNADTLTIQLANQIAANIRSNPIGRGMTLAMVGGIFLLPFGRRLRRAKGKAGRFAGLMLLLMVATCAVLGLTACGGGGSGYFGQQQKNYSVIVTATSGALSHTTTVNFTVE